ncbi:MAG: leucine-rich repeat protein [Muribaculaceae bacterium]|nr:leucine-rich repeat protein [Muribaculaceae bacterium]
MKKILLLFMAVLTLSVTAYAQRIQVFQDGDWAFAINPDAEHEVTVIQYQGKEGSEATELTIPSYATYNGSRYFVTALAEYLFSEFDNKGNDQYTHYWTHDTYTKLEKVTIPNTVTIIQFSAFKGCTALTSVNIPNSVTEIENAAFMGCTALTSVTIPNSVTKIGGNSFSNCTALEIVVEEGNSKYSAVDGVLYNSTGTVLINYPGKQSTFEIPNTVTEINNQAFQKCTSLTSVIIPNSVTKIGSYAFEGCTALTSVNIPNSVTLIDGYAFMDCTALTSVIIPNSVTFISSYTFYNCTALTSVNIPNSVTKIGSYAFTRCSRLTSVTIPNSLTEIVDYTFLKCTGLSTIYALAATPPTCANNQFNDAPKTAVVYVPKGSFKAYFIADGWAHFTDFREMGALDIILSESTISIEEGKTATLTATISKDNDVNIESETWISSDPRVATVADGVVTAVGEGTTTITYTLVDGYGCPHTEYCTVTVTGNAGVEGVEIDGSDAPAEYYNLGGLRVNGDALTPGLYIKRQGGKATKVLVK